jgi:hypothetical protein
MAMRLVFTVISLRALARGGGSDSTTVPVLPTYPNMAGVWSVTGAFPATGTQFQGTVTFSQAALQQPGLTGSANLTIAFPDGPSNYTVINNAAVSENRELRFNVVRTPPLDPWRFVGVVNGTSVTGNCDTSACTFTMAKQ